MKNLNFLNKLKALEIQLPETLTCVRCKGEKRSKIYDIFYDCHSCDKTGIVQRPSVDSILSVIETTRGDKRIRSSLNSFKTEKTAYYVWRMARFHGGIDVHMPVMTFTTHSMPEPYLKFLDLFVDAVAVDNFGSHIKAALIWGNAMGAI